MSQSQQVLYLGSYAATDQPGIYIFTCDNVTGALTACGAFTGITNPSFLVVHPHGPWLYAVSETEQQQDGTGAAGSVGAFRRTREPGTLEPLNSQASGGDLPCHLTLDATGQWVLVSNYGSGSLGVLPILADGALGEMTDLVQHQGRGPVPGRQEGPHAHSTIFTPDQRFVIVADLGIDALRMYTFDPPGRLHAHAQINARPGAGPRHMAFHPNQRYLFVANELDNTVAVYDYDATGGTLRERQIIDTLPPGVAENIVADIHVSPAGDRVYVSNRGHESITMFKVAANGQLERSAVRSCGGRWPRNFALTPDNRFLLVANQYSDQLVVLPTQQNLDTSDGSVAHAAVKAITCVCLVAPDA